MSRTVVKRAELRKQIIRELPKSEPVNLTVLVVLPSITKGLRATPILGWPDLSAAGLATHPPNYNYNDNVQA